MSKGLSTADAGCCMHASARARAASRSGRFLDVWSLAHALCSSQVSVLRNLFRTASQNGIHRTHGIGKCYGFAEQLVPRGMAARSMQRWPHRPCCRLSGGDGAIIQLLSHVPHPTWRLERLGYADKPKLRESFAKDQHHSHDSDHLGA